MPPLDERINDHEDATAVTHHVLDTDRGTIRYTATAGYLDVVEETWSGNRNPATARVFATSYVVRAHSDRGGSTRWLSPEESRARPVTFVYNGGPGSTSMWLHLGLFGPRRVVALNGFERLAPPYEVVDNTETPLIDTDLVVLDFVDSGYSRMAPGEDPAAFHGVSRDVDLASEVVRLWVTRNERWRSPILLAGESYGVLRTAKVAERLISVHGLYPAGLILISSPIGPNTMDFSPGTILASIAFLPSYAAVAHFHGKHPGRALDDVLAEAEAFAAGPFLTALHAGAFLDEDTYEAVVADTARLTGLSPDFVRAVRLKIDNDRFFAELLRDRGMVTGRNDGRFTGWNRDGAHEVPESDPAYDVIRGAYSSAINDYLRRELGFLSDLPFEVLTRRTRPWASSGAPGDGFSAVDSLSSALRLDPLLPVQYHLGYYDLCTPYWGAHTDVAQLDVPRELLDNIEFHHYHSGHMIYLDEDARRELSASIGKFVRRAGGEVRV